MLGGQLRQGFHVFATRNNPRGIRRAVEQNQFCSWSDRCLDFLDIDCKVRSRVDHHALAPCHLHQRGIHHEIRVHENHFVARVQQSEHRHHQRTARAGGDEHPTIRMAILGIDPALQLCA